MDHQPGQYPPAESHAPYLAPPPGDMPERPPWNGKTNGFAIACLTLSLFGCVGLVSVIFGVIALRQTRRNGDRRGRFFAIAGLSICGLWLAAIAVAVVVNLAQGDDRDASGAVRGERSISLNGLRPGDCLKDLWGDYGSSVDVVPCSAPHSSEFVARFALPAGAWPGEAQVQKAGEDGCDKQFKQYAGPNPADGSYVVFPAVPDESDWSGEREVLCLVHHLGDPVTGTMRR